MPQEEIFQPYQRLEYIFLKLKKKETQHFPRFEYNLIEDYFIAIKISRYF